MAPACHACGHLLDRYIEERQRLSHDEEPDAVDAEANRLLWGVLAVMVKHQGQLRNGPKTQVGDGLGPAPSVEMRVVQSLGRSTSIARALTFTATVLVHVVR